MRRLLTTLAAGVFACIILTVSAFAQELVVGGQALGIEMTTRGAMVEGLSQIQTDAGERCPAKDAGVREGDVIVKVSGTPINSAQELIALVSGLDGGAAELEVLRGSDTARITVQPVLNNAGQWMLGLMLRDGIAGIGTLTFFDPDTGIYGALGHSISGEGACVLPLNDGSVCKAQITDVVRGTSGQPGELNGSANGQSIGSIEKNTVYGIYGHMSCEIDGVILPSGEVTTGKATMISTVDGGGACEYSVEINRVYRDNGETRFMLTVTDEGLCGMTGGIVQGMSGSPVVQNGRLVGAVTHVSVST